MYVQTLQAGMLVFLDLIKFLMDRVEIPKFLNDFLPGKGRLSDAHKYNKFLGGTGLQLDVQLQNANRIIPVSKGVDALSILNNQRIVIGSVIAQKHIPIRVETRDVRSNDT